MKNETRKPQLKVVAVLVLGVALLAFGIYLMTANLNRYVETTATITKVEGLFITQKVSVSYTVDGRLYEDIPLGSYASGDKEGNEVTIYYDPEDPSVIEAQGGSTWAKYSTLLGAVLITYSIVTLLRMRKSRGKAS